MVMTLTLNELATIFGMLVAGVSPLLVWVWTVSGRLAKLELKTDTIWEFQMRRAISEAVEKGLGSVNSPFSLHPEVVQKAKALLDQQTLTEIQSVAERYSELPDKDLSLEIERVCGNQLMKALCLPLNLQEGTCLLIALHLAGRRPVRV